MNDLYNDGLKKSESASRRMRELREIGWRIDFIGNAYILNKKGVIPGDDSWGNIRKTISKKTRRRVFERDNLKCTVCGKNSANIELTIGHIIPISLGGSDDFNNLKTECVDCNESWNNEIYNKEERIKELSLLHPEVSLIQDKLSVKETHDVIELLLLKITMRTS